MTHILFEFGIFLLCVDEVEEDVECAGENKGKEQAESSQVDVPLRAAVAHVRGTWW